MGNENLNEETLSRSLGRSIDKSVLEELAAVVTPRSESSALLLDLQALFLDNMPPLISQLEKSIHNSSYREILGLLHRMKSSCSNLGLVQMESLCKQIESWSTSEEPKPLEGSLLAKTLKASFEISKVELDQFIVIHRKKESEGDNASPSPQRTD